MDFYKKKQFYKKEKYNLPKIIKSNKQIFSGSGGSHNIIIIHNDIAIKIIPEVNKHPLEKTKRDNDQKEIKYYILFTNELILQDITPHIVGYYSHYKLFDIEPIFPKKCLTISQKLLLSLKKIDYVKETVCRMKEEYENKIIMSRADILILEKCDATISKETYNIINTKNKNKYKLLVEFIHRTIFQFMYSMACIQKKYPHFIHNDMFLRNILGVYETEFNDNDCVEYIWNNESYYLPANGFYLKINDFGYSLNPPKIVSTVLTDIKFNPLGSMWEYDDQKRDIYTFLYDYYDGANLGNSSIMNIIGNKSYKIKKFIRKQFAKYINVQLIDKIHKNSRYLLHWIWNIKNIKLLQDSILLPHQYFSKNIFKRYKAKKNWNVVKTFQYE